MKTLDFGKIVRNWNFNILNIIYLFNILMKYVYICPYFYKMMRRIRNSTVVLLIFMSCQTSFAQYIEVGFGLGKSVYWGDLNAPEFSKNISENGSLAIQLCGKYNYQGIFGIKLNTLFGKISGNDKFSSLQWQRERNLSFSSKLLEVSVMGELYLFNFTPGFGEQVFSPFITVGVAGFFYNPVTEFNGNVVELQPLGTEGQGMSGYGAKYNKYGFGVPFGAGGLFKFSDRFTMSFDIIGRRTFSDYIDDVSGTYVSYDELSAGNGVLAAQLSDRTPEYFGSGEPSQHRTGDIRGGANVEDYYFTAMVTMFFSITDPDEVQVKRSRHNTNCPKF